MTNVQMNGVLLSNIGVTLLSGAYGELLTPAPLKDYIENDDPTKDGVQIDTLVTPKQKSRDLTLRFLIQGNSVAQFAERYSAFVNMLYGGEVELFVPDIGMYFHLLYTSVTKYGNYRLNACEVAVKFREPDPTNRGA